MHLHLPEWLDRIVYESWELKKGDVQMFVRRLRWLGIVDALIMVPNGPLYDVWRFDRITHPQLVGLIDAGAEGTAEARTLCSHMYHESDGASFRTMTADEVRVRA